MDIKDRTVLFAGISAGLLVVVVNFMMMMVFSNSFEEASLARLIKYYPLALALVVLPLRFIGQSSPVVGKFTNNDDMAEGIIGTAMVYILVAVPAMHVIIGGVASGFGGMVWYVVSHGILTAVFPLLIKKGNISAVFKMETKRDNEA